MEAFQALLGDDFCFLLSPHIVARTPRKRPIMTSDHADKMEITVVFQCPPVTGRWNVMDALAEKYYAWSHDERASIADGLFSKKMGGLPVLVIGKDKVTRGFYYDFNDGKSFGFGDSLRFHELNKLSSWLNQHRRFFLQVK